MPWIKTLVLALTALLAACDQGPSPTPQTKEAAEHREKAAQHMEQILKTEDPHEKEELLKKAQQEQQKSNDLRHELPAG